MIRLFLKAALRNLKRSPLNTTINILGLALGFTVALISTLWVLKQFSFALQQLSTYLSGHDDWNLQ